MVVVLVAVVVLIVALTSVTGSDTATMGAFLLVL